MPHRHPHLRSHGINGNDHGIEFARGRACSMSVD